ncbi:MAG TPA: tetratricopeptide repeat protein [Chitinophagaceae bacterium]|nr:tetratricopeptide repeat protein [Chitinophagaceae bacterium]
MHLTRKIFLLLLFTGSVLYGISQSINTDSLFRSLAKSIPDSDKVLTLLRISNAYFHSNPDTSRKYVDEGLVLAKRIHYRLGEAKALTIIGNQYTNDGKFPQALKTHLQVLQISEELDNPVMTAAAFNNIAVIYETQHDYRNALENYLKAKKIYEQLAKDKTATPENIKKVNSYLITTILNVGSDYEQMNLLDSALYYQNEAYEFAIRFKDNNQGLILVNLGSIYFKLGEYGLSESNYRAAIHHLQVIDDKYSIADALEGISSVYVKLNETDSALLYAMSSLSYAKSGSNVKALANASLLISQAYEKKQKIDSAYYYYKISVTTRDSMFNDEVVRQVQSMNLIEQTRQKDKAEAKVIEIAERKKNLQMMAIALFIVALFGVLAIWSKKRIRPKWLRYLGLLGLLLMFEFISYFLHPYISKITYHIPALIVLAYVALGSALLPIHHRIELWVEKELSHKRKRHSKKHAGNKPQAKVLKNTQENSDKAPLINPV